MTINQGIQYIKNPYLFSHNESELDNLDNSNYLDEISHSVKPIEERYANIEAEQHEVLFQEGKLYNILGKPHSKGGTPLNAKEGSFIFSKFTPLNINKKDKKLFELNAVKSDKIRNNSPAQILKKEVDFKHHNKMFKVLEDRMQDDISKKSAELMLGKNLQLVGKIGYLQEEKKNFPTGVPTFADGSTPIVNKELENKIMQSSQFMQLGGMKKYVPGGQIVNVNLPCEFGKHPDGSCILFEELSDTQKAQVRAKASKVTQFSPGFNEVENVNGFQVGEKVLPPTGFKLTGPQDPNWKRTFEKLKRTNPARAAEITAEARRQKAQREGSAEYQIIQPTASATTSHVDTLGEPLSNVEPMGSTAIGATSIGKPKDSTAIGKSKFKETDNLTPGDPLNYSSNPFNSQARLNGYQNANTAYLLGQGLNVKKYMPMRPQIRSNIPFVETYDYQPVLNQIDNGVAQQYDAGRFSSSPQQGAINSLVAGKALQAKSQAIGQINAQNVPLRNQQRILAAQTLNQDNQFNVGQNLQYYDKVQLANSNYDTLKQAGINAAVGDYNTNLSMLDKFKQLEASQKMGQQYIRGEGNKVELRDKDGKSEYFTEDELKTRKDEILKRGLTIQTRQAPLFSTDRFGRVVNNRIDVNPLGMAPGTGNGGMTYEEYRKLSKDQQQAYVNFMGLYNNKNERQPVATQKLGGKISKRYTVKNPFNQNN
jgi:hypothetical protein